MVLDGLRADEQVLGDLPVGVPLGGKPGYLRFLRRQLVDRVERAVPDMLAGRLQLDARPFRKAFHPELAEELVGRAQLGARVDTTTLASEPLAIEEVCSGQVDSEGCRLKPLNRVAVQRFGGFAIR